MRRVLLQQARPEYQALLDLTEPYHRAFAERHGLEYRRFNGAVLPDWPGFWDQMALIDQVLGEEDVAAVYWLDADALALGDVDPSEGLGRYKVGMVRHPGPPEHFNVGTLFLENCEAVRGLILEVLANGPGVWPWWQQQVLNDLLAKSKKRARLVGEMDVRWNSTFGIRESAAPVIVAWHGGQGPVKKWKAMRRFLDANPPPQSPPTGGR